MYQDDAQAQAEHEASEDAEAAAHQAEMDAQGRAEAETAESPLDRALADFRATFQAVQQEAKARAEIEASEEYQNLQWIIERTQAEQAEMLAKIPDSREEHSMDRTELLALMAKENVYKLPGFKVKTRVVREVDTLATLHALGGDLDAMMLVSSIKIGALEAFIKDNQELRRDLKKCIIEKGVTITDIVPEDTIATAA